ncbi:MAG: hypothetical protein ACLTOZ_11165, partial [[Clostridium] leptum]
CLLFFKDQQPNNFRFPIRIALGIFRGRKRRMAAGTKETINLPCSQFNQWRSQAARTVLPNRSIAQNTIQPSP